MTKAPIFSGYPWATIRKIPIEEGRWVSRIYKPGAKTELPHHINFTDTWEEAIRQTCSILGRRDYWGDCWDVYNTGLIEAGQEE